MFEPEKIEISVIRLLDEIRKSAKSLNTLLRDGNALPDLEERLDRINIPLHELVELQLYHREEVSAIVPNFSAELADAYEAVSRAGLTIDHRKRPDLDEMAQEAFTLLRSLDESSTRNIPPSQGR